MSGKLGSEGSLPLGKLAKSELGPLSPLLSIVGPLSALAGQDDPLLALAFNETALLLLIEGRAATGQWTVGNANAFANNDSLTIPDGSGGTVVIEFQIDGTYVPTPGAYTVDLRPILPDGTYDDVIALVAAIVAAHTTIGMPSGGEGHQNAVYSVAGVAGNLPIVASAPISGAVSAVAFAGGPRSAAAVAAGRRRPRRRPARRFCSLAIAAHRRGA